jgi:MFS family permease
MLMSGYQTILQLSALVGFWGAYASNAIFPSSSSLQWQLPVAIQLFPGILLLLGTLYIPESPRFLAEILREDKAEKALAWLRGIKKGEEWKAGEEMEEVRDAAAVSRRLGERNVSFWVEIVKKGVRGRLVVGVGLMIAQNMVGLNALNYCKLFPSQLISFFPNPEPELTLK